MPERSPITAKLIQYMPKRRVPLWKALLIGCACTGSGFLLRLLIDPFVFGVPFVTFFPMLVVATFWGGLGAGTCALLLSAIVGTYEWLPPHHSFELGLTSAMTMAAFLFAGGTVVFSVHLVNEVLAALLRSEARSAMIAGEMQHRVKNVLQLVSAISRLTAAGADTVEDHENRLAERIRALALAGDTKRKAPHLPLELEELLGQLLRPFDLTKFTLSGPATSVTDEVGSSIGLAIHELGTNAVKYGALRAPSGRVSLRWQHNGKLVEIDWIERDGPEVASPRSEGFGSKLLRSVFSAEGGTSEVQFAREGLRCKLRCPRAF
jgi:two-component sensor histidine kinase